MKPKGLFMTCLLVTMLETNNKEWGVDYFIDYLAFAVVVEAKLPPTHNLVSI